MAKSSKRITTIVAAVSKCFSPGDEGTQIDPSDECIRCGIIYLLVNVNLTHDLLDLLIFTEGFNKLMLKLRVVNWAAQVQEWLNFISIEPSNCSTMEALHEAFRNMAKTFNEKGVSLCWDNMIRLIIQSNLQDNLHTSVDQKIKLLMESHDYQTPLSQDVPRFLCSQNQTTTSGVKFSARCYICCKPDYLAPNCPNKRPGGPTGQSFQKKSFNQAQRKFTFGYEKLSVEPSLEHLSLQELSVDCGQEFIWEWHPHFSILLPSRNLTLVFAWKRIWTQSAFSDSVGELFCTEISTHRQIPGPSKIVEMHSIFKGHFCSGTTFLAIPARQIRRLVKHKLGYALPDKMPTGTIKCPSLCSLHCASKLG
ncbi:uncharacterized protein VP01_1112g4 [Puccinia sorghi]|uniref:CCHC-type domain-containing protein n=1 Tax=Puccinia sorghi TaxID=27349 RepID=A0A0L6VU05_9BASI|nr:uncharacterized protein VP01_1112g4 [Puccinia sorghi]